MSANPNPYESPNSSVDRPSNRRMPLVLSAISMFVFMNVGFNLLFCYGVSAMVDPALSESEKNRSIAREFLFGHGPFQVVEVFGLGTLTFASLLLSFIHPLRSWSGRSSLRVSILWSIIGGLVCATSLILFFVVRL